MRHQAKPMRRVATDAERLAAHSATVRYRDAPISRAPRQHRQLAQGWVLVESAAGVVTDSAAVLSAVLPLLQWPPQDGRATSATGRGYRL